MTFECQVNVLNADDYPPNMVSTWAGGDNINNKLVNLCFLWPEDQHLATKNIQRM